MRPSSFHFHGLALIEDDVSGHKLTPAADFRLPVDLYFSVLNDFFGFRAVRDQMCGFDGLPKFNEGPFDPDLHGQSSVKFTGRIT